MSSRDGLHDCPWPGCEKRVRRDLWDEAAHTSAHGSPMRRRIYSAWFDGTAAQHSAALQAADEWIAAKVRSESAAS